MDPLYLTLYMVLLIFMLHLISQNVQLPLYLCIIPLSGNTHKIIEDVSLTYFIHTFPHPNKYSKVPTEDKPRDNAIFLSKSDRKSVYIW